jgi:uncharacterized protein (UPF0303 family)
MFDVEIKFDDSGLSYKWNGGTLISCYEQMFGTYKAEEINCFTVNGLSENKDWNLVIQEMKNYHETVMNWRI